MRYGAAVLLGMALLAGNAARAAFCGDDVDGRDVPCACGDEVVSRVALGDDDPITHGGPCPGDGLIVRNPDSPRPIVVDLRGRRLVGSGRGVGLRLIAGGPGGAHVMSSGGPATIVGFDDGIVGRGVDAVAVIEDVIVADPVRDGVRLGGTEYRVQRVEVHGAGRDGFALGGRGFEIAATRAIGSGRYGYVVMGYAGHIGRTGAGNVAERSGAAGFNVMGSGHVIAACEATFGKKEGIHLQAARIDLRGCRAADNGGTGIEGIGNAWRLSGNEAARNGGAGLSVRGVDLIDEGGNRGSDNGTATAVQAAVQCAIAGTPCVL